MIAILITVVFGISAYVCAANGEWGPAAVGIVIILIAWALHGAAIDTSKAYNHRIEYWAKTEEERYRDRLRAKAKVDSEMQAERTKMAKRYEAEREKQHKRNGTIQCPSCGQTAWPVNGANTAEGQQYKLYRCPYCRAEVWR